MSYETNPDKLVITDKKIQTFLFGYNDEGDCWEWEKSINPQGYGTFYDGNGNVLAHRFSFAYFNYQPNPKLVIDHKCENRKCVNPDHLQETTQLRNTLYSPTSIAVVNKYKTFCVNGHDYVEGSYTRDKRGSRVCIQCKKDYNKTYKRKLKVHQD